MARIASLVVLSALLALLYCHRVHAHGYLQVPRSRNYIANLQGQEFCPHCLSAGGPATVKSLAPGGLFPVPTETVASAVRSNLCGEAANSPLSSRHYNPAPVPSLLGLPTYTPGQEFDMEVVITAHHRGHFDFRLCDASTLSDPTTLTWACLSQHVLQRVPVPGEVSPVDVNHPERYYLEPECAPNYNKTIRMRYKIPSDVSCQRCVLQWWWVTANSCNPPDYGKRSPQPAHVAQGCNWWQADLPVCLDSYPEEFWNCADIRVLGETTPAEPAAVIHSDPPPPQQPVQTPPPAVPAQPTAPVPAGQCRPCTTADGPQCDHPGAATQLWCTQNCPQGVNDQWCPVTHCTCGSATVTQPAEAAPATPPPAVPVVPPATPKAPPATPKAPPATPVAPPKAPATPPKAPAVPASNCAGLGWQCGGDGWTGPTCCAQGTCMAYISTYSQCRNECPLGWLCNTKSREEKSYFAAAVDWAKHLVE